MPAKLATIKTTDPVTTFGGGSRYKYLGEMGRIGSGKHTGNKVVLVNDRLSRANKYILEPDYKHYMEWYVREKKKTPEDYGKYLDDSRRYHMKQSKVVLQYKGRK